MLVRVRQRIDAGRLPLFMPTTISAGYGTGAEVCQLCDLGISAEQTMYEVSDPRTSRLLGFHFACYVLWQRECSQRLASRK
ncbi:MAG TPA: hypothetical protein VI195_09255 [Steroidobacteraceae bacterium]